MAISNTHRSTRRSWSVCLLCLSFVSCFGTKTREPICEPLNVEQCRNVGYNKTGIPNIFGDTSQVDIEHKLMEINVLLTATCAKSVRFFFCSMYAPMCSPQTRSLITSCRPLCQYVTERCRPTAEKFRKKWLNIWNCSQFHPNNNEGGKMCMTGPPLHNLTYVITTASTATETTNYGKMSFKNSQNYIYLERFKSWVLLCSQDGVFRADDKDFAELWMTVWSVACFVSTAVTILTFLVDTQRFRYPERSIVMLAFCYNLYSIGYIIRLVLGRESVSCEENDGVSYVTPHGLGNPACTFVFFILYLFGMAAHIWWVILALTWFLAAGMKWSYEAIGSYSNLFHLIAWILPVIKTALVLIFRKVDGDELTGLCYVGNQDLLALTGFVLGPQFTYLIIGTLFLVAGFIALYRIRLTIQNEGLTKIDKLDRFIVRIGVFSVFYTVPATCVIGTQFYEYGNRDNWIYGKTKPNINVLRLKICMSLVVGIISGMWMWTAKTCTSWKNFYQKTFSKQPVIQNGSNHNLALRNGVTIPTQPIHESEV